MPRNKVASKVQEDKELARRREAYERSKKFLRSLCEVRRPLNGGGTARLSRKINSIGIAGLTVEWSNRPHQRYDNI